MNRRDFIGKTALTIPVISMFPADLSSLSIDREKNKIERRTLGKTGVKLSAIGFGGIVVRDSTTEEAATRVKHAIDAGINYFDVAPSYGNAEEMLGPALEPYRDNVFLACKTMERGREGSRKELEESLEKLRTDHFDLYQFHAVTTLEDVEKIFEEGGAMETFQEARQEGKIKYIGFSAHSVEAAMALMDRYDFDTILFPFSWATWYAGNFGPQVMERAKKNKMGILALKAMAHRPWPKGAERYIKKTWYEPLTDREEARRGLRFTLSHPVTSALPPGDENLFAMAIDLARDFKPLKKSEIMEIKRHANLTEPLFHYPMKS